MSKLKQYRKKPVVIHAIQWTGGNDFAVKILRWIRKGNIEDAWAANYSLFIKTLEGTMEASLDDWIIKGVKGEFYPCKPDIFEATYEPVEADDPVSDLVAQSLEPQQSAANPPSDPKRKANT